MRIRNEDEILDIEIRKKIISQIKGPENRARKDEAYKRYECYKDLTARYVAEQLLKQFESDTVQEMEYALSNVSIARKIIDKLARVYANGVQRTVNAPGDDGSFTPDDVLSKAVEDCAKVLDFDSNMKKVNRQLKLQKNCALMIKPFQVQENGSTKWSLKMEVMAPYLYDVIENFYDREKPMVYVLSHYIQSRVGKELISLNAGREGRGYTTPQLAPEGGTKDELIADAPQDDNVDREHYIFWSDNYHFTSDKSGEIVHDADETVDDADDSSNPIGALPFVNFAIDQDGAFWALGGNDLVDGAILINSLLTNINHIGITQGYGQFYMVGKNLPKVAKTGPNRSILMEVESKDDPTPSIGFASAHPPLNELMANLEMYVALLLTTNNLTASNISGKLDSSVNKASGISLIIDKAESIEDVQDQAKIFHDKEPIVWSLVEKWSTLYGSKKLLTEKLTNIMIPPNPYVVLKFGDASPIMSEAEKLDNLQKRQNLGLNTEIELLMRDDSSLTKETAALKLIQIQQEKIAFAKLKITEGLFPLAPPANGGSQAQQEFADTGVAPVTDSQIAEGGNSGH